MHSTRLWLQPQEHQSTEVWPTGRESTSQRKSITQVQTSTDRIEHCSVLCLSFKGLLLSGVCVSLVNVLMCRSAVGDGPGRSKPPAGGQPWSRGGHRLFSGRRHRIVPGTDERRRSHVHRCDSCCEGRHRAALPLRAFKKKKKLYQHHPWPFHRLNESLKFSGFPSHLFAVKCYVMMKTTLCLDS